jgi:hypothetical protein
MKIAVVLVATGATYRKFLETLVPQIHQNFQFETKIILVSDVHEWPDVNHVHRVDHLPFPLPSLFRHYWMAQMESHLSQFDYVYYLDVDSEVLQPIGEEILRPVIAVRHWCWPTRDLTPRAPFERDRGSQAFVDATTAQGYFQASFQGGETNRYLAANRTIAKRINVDLMNGAKGTGGRIACWYDESHWNRYVNEHYGEFHILGPEYALGPTSWSFAASSLTLPAKIKLQAKPGDELWGQS